MRFLCVFVDQDKFQEGTNMAKLGPNMRPKMAKMRPKMPKMRLKMAKIRHKNAKMRPNICKTRPKMAKMRAKMTKMRAKMAKMRPKMAKMRPRKKNLDTPWQRISGQCHFFAPLPRKTFIFEDNMKLLKSVFFQKPPFCMGGVQFSATKMRPKVVDRPSAPAAPCVCMHALRSFRSSFS